MGSGERRTVPVDASPDLGGTEEEAARQLCRLLEESVARRVSGRRRVAVSFSGGLDSSIVALLAASGTPEVVLCSAYTEASTDHGYTARAAESLGLEHRGALIDGAEAARLVGTLDLPFAPGPMDRALWCLFSTTSRLATENGAELILLGQLADELFGGYMKYSLEARRDEASAVRMMEHDVAASADGAFIRDELACSRSLEVRFPFADEGLAGLARVLPLAVQDQARREEGDTEDGRVHARPARERSSRLRRRPHSTARGSRSSSAETRKCYKARHNRPLFPLAPERTGTYLPSDDTAMLIRVLSGSGSGICLEIGFGSGAVLQSLLPRFSLVVGTDITSLDQARAARGSAEVVLADRASCFREGTFDLVAFNPPPPLGGHRGQDGGRRQGRNRGAHEVPR